jgi:hypothetical protein
MEFIIIWIVVVILLFLLCRELICWYYKINERITLQTETNELLKKILEKKGNIYEDDFLVKNEIKEEIEINNNEQLTEAIKNNQFEKLEDVLIIAKKLELIGIVLSETNLQFIVGKYKLNNIKELKENISKTIIN